MTRRVHERREPTTPKDQGEQPTEPAPMQGLRVAGEVSSRDATEVQRIAGVLEVTSWIRRMHRRH